MSVITDVRMELFEYAIVLVAAIVPSLIYLAWIRNAERRTRERWARVLPVYLFGMIVSVLAAVLLELMFFELFYLSGTMVTESIWNFEPYDPTIFGILLAVVIAPFVEEWTKSWGVMAVRHKVTSVQDGFVYGAAAGLGFAAMENVFYISAALLSGYDVFLATALLRAVSSTLLHASASAVLGYGIVRKYLKGAKGGKAHYVQYYMAAVALHAIFNGFAILSEVFDDPDLSLLGVICATMIAAGMFLWMKREVRVMDLR